MLVVFMQTSRMEKDFVNTIMATSNRLCSVGLEVTQKWIGAFMLAAVPDTISALQMLVIQWSLIHGMIRDMFL